MARIRATVSSSQARELTVYALAFGATKISKRLTVALVVLVLVLSATFAAMTSASPTAVTAQVQKSGAVVVTGYDGGVALAPVTGSSTHP